MEWIAAARRHPSWLVIAGYLVFAAAFGTVKLDVDEFKIVKEPYELLGGDYTLGYLKAHEFDHALDCAARSYRFYWQYRPRFSPIIAERDRTLFAAEERRFGYVATVAVIATGAETVADEIEQQVSAAGKCGNSPTPPLKLMLQQVLGHASITTIRRQ
jgi:hypothetical protein